MSEQNPAYIYDIGGDVKGIIGDVRGVVHQYIIAQKSEAEIHSQRFRKGSPYLGLKKFESEDQDKFFGREQWITKLSKDLEQDNLLLLLGKSGSGKSSLVQAGIIPYLSDEWGSSKLVKLIFVPYQNPFKSFYDSLPRKYKDEAGEIIKEKEPGTLVKLIKNLKEDSHKWLLFIDQFEELFTLTPKLERDKFINNLVALIRQQENSVKLIIAMRSDFLDNLIEYSDFTNKVEGQIRLIKKMTESELRLAIAEPSARNGVTFEKGLVKRIISNFDQQAGSLPLLQYTLDSLWEKNKLSENNKVLSIATYQAIGGVSGALQKQADSIYNKLRDEEKEAVKKIFIELIDLKDIRSKEPVSRRVEQSQFKNDAVTEKTLNKLINYRLLVIGKDQEDEIKEEEKVVDFSNNKKTTVEVAHEELLRSWRFIQNLIQEQEEIIILRSRLNQDAYQWDEWRKQNEEKAKDELWSGSKLERVLELIDEQAFGSLDKVAKEFIDASVELRDRQNQEKEEQIKQLKEERKKAELNLADSLGRSSVSLFREGSELDAFVEAIKAGKIRQKYKETAPTVINALQEILNERSERNRLIGHKGRVKSIAFSPDGQILASASEDGTVKLWNLKGEELQASLNHGSKVGTVAFSPDNQILASAGNDGTVKLWKQNNTGQFETQPDQTLIEHEGVVNSVAFSPDPEPNNQILASAGNDGTVKLWKQNNTGQFEAQPDQTPIEHGGVVNSVAFSPDPDPNNQILASAGDDKTIKLWKRNSTGQFETQPDQTLIMSDENFNSIAFSPDGQMLASASRYIKFMGGTVKLWKRNSTGQFETQPDQILEGDTGEILSVAFSADGKTIATGNEFQTVNLWKRDGTDCRFKTKPDKILEGHTGWNFSVAFSPDGQILASASGDTTIKLWNLEEKKNAPEAFIGHKQWVWNLAFSPDGQILASASGDGTVKLWNLKGKELQASLDHYSKVHDHYPTVRTLAFSPDGQILATSGDNQKIKLWKRNSTGQFETPPDQILRGHGASSVAFSPDGQILASASVDTTVKLWRRNGQGKFNTHPDQILERHEDGANRAIFSPDGETIATVGNDQTIKLWRQNSTGQFNTQPDQILKSDDVEISGLAFSPDGKTIATSGSDRTVKLWKQDTIGQFASEPDQILIGHKDLVGSVAFSPDGQILASASGVTVKLWNLKGEELLTLYNPFHGRRDWLRSVVFSPDGKSIVAGGGLGIKIILWRNLDELKLNKLMGSACNWVRDYLQYSQDAKEKNITDLCDEIGN